MLSSTVPSLFAILALISSHTVVAHSYAPPANFKRDNMFARRTLEETCGSALAARREKRNIERRQRIWKRGLKVGGGLLKRETNSNDSTCLLDYEVTQGPYHVLGSIVRQNMTEGQAGVPLEVSIDFFDISTCEPVRVWVDAWHANATGVYSGYIASSVSDSTANAGSVSDGGAKSGGGAPLKMESSDSSTITSIGFLSGADTSGSGAVAAGTDTQTFLRGAWESDDDGYLTMQTIVPGWYTGRAQHFHLKAYPAASAYVAPNGTFIVIGSAVHTGQVFFDNSTLTAVAATTTYASNSISWSDATKNDEDMITANGNNANFDITWVGDSIEEGLLGHVNIGLNLSYSSPETTNFWSGFNVSEYVKADLLTTYATSQTAVSSTATTTFATTTKLSSGSSSSLGSLGAAITVTSGGSRLSPSRFW
ncbi:aromatic compound dioxygenase [Meredithblackwellia eburnea MCA 4105]